MAEKRTKNKITYQTILDFCEQKGWETLETEYINANTPMKWRCKTCSYEFKTSFTNIRNKISCSKCAGSRIQHTQESVEKIVNLKGITLIEPYTRNKISCSNYNLLYL
jgi:DNA-directed RNA polymerase subunit RPC12/RpoP